MRCSDLLSHGLKTLLRCGVLFLSALPGRAQESAVKAQPAALYRDTAVYKAATQLRGTAPTLEAALQDLFARADVVFTGEVTSIEHTPAGVQIMWRVDDAVRGAAAGGTYMLREWQGLWQGDASRYRKGQRALVLLHASSAAGFGSPVGGSDGVITLRGEGGASSLDLRLLAQRVQVTDAARLRPAAMLKAANGSLAWSDELQREQSARQGGERLQVGRDGRLRMLRQAPEAGGGVDVDAAQPSGESGLKQGALPLPEPDSNVDGTMVLSMLHAWQARAGAAR